MRKNLQVRVEFFKSSNGSSNKNCWGEDALAYIEYDSATNKSKADLQNVGALFWLRLCWIFND